MKTYTVNAGKKVQSAYRSTAFTFNVTAENIKDAWKAARRNVEPDERVESVRVVKKASRGGARAGSGRPAKFKEETAVVAFRVPASLKEDLYPKISLYVQALVKTAKMGQA
jgi:hypothetical protein